MNSSNLSEGKIAALPEHLHWYRQQKNVNENLKNLSSDILDFLFKISVVNRVGRQRCIDFPPFPPLNFSTETKAAKDTLELKLYSS